MRRVSTLTAYVYSHSPRTTTLASTITRPTRHLEEFTLTIFIYSLTQLRLFFLPIRRVVGGPFRIQNTKYIPNFQRSDNSSAGKINHYYFPVYRWFKAINTLWPNTIQIKSIVYKCLLYLTYLWCLWFVNSRSRCSSYCSFDVVCQCINLVYTFIMRNYKLLLSTNAVLKSRIIWIRVSNFWIYPIIIWVRFWGRTYLVCCNFKISFLCTYSDKFLKLIYFAYFNVLKTAIIMKFFSII